MVERKNLRQLVCTLGITALSLLPACIKRKSDSFLKHDFGQWGDMDQDATTWQETSISEFLAQRPDIKDRYSDDDPRVVRIQEWANAIHSVIRGLTSRLPPAPKILLVKDSSVNGYVSGLAVCIHVPVEFTGVSNDATSTDSLLGLMGSDEGISRQTSEQKCVDRPADVASIQSLLKGTLGEESRCASVLPKTNESQISVKLDVPCLSQDRRAKLDGIKSMNGIIYLGVSNVIVLHDALLKFSEPEVVAVLAHEAAHYYRAHSVTKARPYDFFYQLDEAHNLGGRPQPLPAENPIAKLGSEVQDLRTAYLNLNAVSGQKFHSVIFPLARQLVNQLDILCTTKTCKDSCKPFAAEMSAIHDMKSAEQVAAFPLSPLPEEEKVKTFYQAYETKAPACMEKIAINTDKIHQESLNLLLASTPIRNLRNKINLNRYSNLGDFVSDLNRKAETLVDEQNQKVMDTFVRANNNRVGFYTTEQEADEISLELIARLGLAYDAPLMAHIHLLKEGISGLPGELNYAQCQEAYAKGFKDFVPIGDWMGVHHSGCFRAYNLYREMNVHKEAMSGVKVSQSMQLNPEIWKSFQPAQE